jgi:hypothetical protein
MLQAPIRPVFDVVTDFLAAEPTPEALLAYHLPPELQMRVDWLIERNGEGQLTFDEQQELFDFIRADQMIALLKTKTKLRLRNLKP